MSRLTKLIFHRAFAINILQLFIYIQASELFTSIFSRMEASPFSSHHRALLPPPFFMTPGSRLSASVLPPPAPLPQRLYRPACTVSEAMAASAIKFSSASYSHSIARLAGIQTELEVRLEDLINKTKC